MNHAIIEDDAFFETMETLSPCTPGRSQFSMEFYHDVTCAKNVSDYFIAKEQALLSYRTAKSASPGFSTRRDLRARRHLFWKLYSKRSASDASRT